MKWITPDTAIVLIVVIGVVILAAFLAWPSLSDGWRPFLGIALPVVAAAFPLLWISNVRVRILAYRLWYKVAGPSVEIQVIGIVPLNPESRIDDELNRVKSDARSWKDNARVDAELDNRIIIAAGARTLTATLMRRGGEEGCDSDEAGDSLDLHFELRGYQARVTTVDDLLLTDVAPLLQKLTDRGLANRRTPSLSLNLDMGGRNPFLGFYLRDVATERIQAFQIRLLDERVSSHKVRVEVTMNRLSLQASDPFALVSTARRYLASPALANLD